MNVAKSLTGPSTYQISVINIFLILAVTLTFNVSCTSSSLEGGTIPGENPPGLNPDGGQPVGDGSINNRDGSTDNGNGNGTSADVGPPPPPPTVVTPAPQVRFARLTHTQWSNSIRDLLSLSEAPSPDLLRADTVNNIDFLFDNDSESMSIDSTLLQNYKNAAQQIANQVTADLDTLTDLPSSGSQEDRVRAFIRNFGLKAFRRSISDAEVDSLYAVFLTGSRNPLQLDALQGGMVLLIEAMLTSPHFLYRVERGSTTTTTGSFPLNGFEIATRLSYFLWNTTPDATLLQHAAEGRLDIGSTEFTNIVTSMVNDPRATAVMEKFHSLVLDFARIRAINPAVGAFPDAPENLASLAEREGRLFVGYIFDASLGWTDMLSASTTFVNNETAPLYGFDPSSLDATFQRVDLNPSERRGILTQIGYLAGHSSSAYPDPIHRGVGVSTRILCNDIPSPPNMMMPSVEPDPDRTNRQDIEAMTEQPQTTCQGCHQRWINPFGFPFEMYNAVGQVQTTARNGDPIDSSASPQIGSDVHPVQNAIDMINVLVASRQVHECYAKHLVEFATGRANHIYDTPLIRELGESSLSGASIKQLIIDIISSRAFLERNVEELP